MAKLKILCNGKERKTNDFTQIQNCLKSEGIEFGQFELNALSEKKAKQDTLTEQERIKIIDSYPELIKKYSKTSGYRADMVCLYSKFKHLGFVLKKFKDVHFHYENEHWHYIDGSSGFGFLGKDGQKFILDVFAGEYVTVPEGKWQWVIPPKDNRMKAIRFFSCTGLIATPELPLLN